MADFPQSTADPLPPLVRELLAEVRQLRHECNRLWLLAFTPKERQEILLDRLDRAAELTASPDVDDHLDAAWQAYLASLDAKAVTAHDGR